MFLECYRQIEQQNADQRSDKAKNGNAGNS
jgi:hypothetical protein